MRAGARWARPLLDEDPQRAAVDGDALHVVQEQALAREQLAQRRGREVAEVLVVDRVELEVLEEVAQVRRLDDGGAVRPEQAADAAHEVLRVRHVRQHVAGEDQRRLPPFRLQPRGERLGEEGVDGLDARRPRRLHRVRRGSMPSTRWPRAATCFSR
jgi:hypothetical protein